MTDILEDDAIMEELYSIGKEDIQKHKCIQSKLLFIKDIKSNMIEKKQKYYQVPIEKQFKLLECVDEKPKSWTFTIAQLDSILAELNSKLSAIDLSNVDLQRLEALLFKAGISDENGKSPLEIYEDALSVHS